MAGWVSRERWSGSQRGALIELYPDLPTEETMKLIRTDYHLDGILGTLCADDGSQLAVTLEHS